jgi:predicted PurR-regulated permease PerM
LAKKKSGSAEPTAAPAAGATPAARQPAAVKDPAAPARRRGQIATALPWLGRADPAVLRLVLFAGALVAVVWVLIAFSEIFLPLMLGLAIAYLFDPAVSWLERRRVPRIAGVVIITLILALLITGFFFYVVPQMNQQVRRLVDRMPEYQERMQETVQPWLERTRARYPEQWEDLRTRAVEGLRENLPRLTEEATDVLRGFFSTVGGVLLFILNLVFVPVFAFYLLVDFPKIRQRVVELIPLPYREITLARVREVDQAVASFLRGQLVIALILAVINSTGLMILDVPMGLVIGIVAGLANMIPYMALVVGLAPALLLSWVEHQSLVNLLGVVLVFTGAQMLEGMVLSPRILGKSVNLHPVWVLLAVIIGGSAMGVLGMLIAVPAAAAIQVFVRHWVAGYKGSRVYTGAGET